MKKKRFPKEKVRRGIYILPNLFTTMNMFCGFYAVLSAINGRFAAASLSIIIAVVFDALDGKIARATNTTSRFGVEYDSLADLISFGLAPGLMMYLWALKPMGRIGWLAGFLFLACGALRLARFNTQSGTVSSDYFVGLPIPAGAGMCAATVLICHKFGIEDAVPPVLVLPMIYALAFLMVSTIKYNSFKKPELFRQMNFNVLVGAILILVFIAAQPSVALFILGLTYVLSGPFMLFHRHRELKEALDSEPESNEPESHSV
jgi:CDP-diacylglycerol---serine O-phosphatidyltransferase